MNESAGEEGNSETPFDGLLSRPPAPDLPRTSHQKGGMGRAAQGQKRRGKRPWPQSS
jgi:hypothetical protein